MSRLILFDTEFTAWEGSLEREWSLEWEHRELIQVAALKVEFSSAGISELDRFESFSRPILNPELSDYIIRLTGIGQAQIDRDGRDFPEVMADFHAFCEGGRLPLYSWGPDDGVVLAENCAIHGVAMPPFESGFIDVREPLAAIGIEVGRFISGSICRDYGGPVTGHLHNALHDIRCVANALNHFAGRLEL